MLLPLGWTAVELQLEEESVLQSLNPVPNTSEIGNQGGLLHVADAVLRY